MLFILIKNGSIVYNASHNAMEEKSRIHNFALFVW